MKHSLKVAKVGCILAFIAIIITAFNILYAVYSELSVHVPVIQFLCMVSIFCANLSMYQAKKKNENKRGVN
ncbi:MAG: hypothetical protein K0R00_528 [Herbinix sp.]|jgi:hypothetical protein|nr:hypothetical protein [Herbinix sp.]